MSRMASRRGPQRAAPHLGLAQIDRNIVGGVARLEPLPGREWAGSGRIGKKMAEFVRTQFGRRRVL